MAPSMAMRWSPRASIVPPASGVPSPRTTKPSAVSSMSAPSAWRASTTASMRSDSLWRSSSAPLTTVSPLGERTEEGNERELVDGQRDLVAGSRRCPPAARRPHRARPWAPRRRSVPGSSRSPTITAPIRSAMRRKPGSRPIQAHVLDHNARARDQARGGHHEGGRRRVARHGDLIELQLVDLVHRRSASRRARTAPAAAQDPLGVVAALGGLA